MSENNFRQFSLSSKLFGLAYLNLTACSQKKSETW